MPELQSGFPILYDAEVEDLDVDGDLEVGYGLGLRFGEAPQSGGTFCWCAGDRPRAAHALAAPPGVESLVEALPVRTRRAQQRAQRRFER